MREIKSPYGEEVHDITSEASDLVARRRQEREHGVGSVGAGVEVPVVELNSNIDACELDVQLLEKLVKEREV